MSFQDIPLKKIYPSPSNYRRSFDETAMAELTASIKSKGVLQPILVRPLSGKQKGSFEIVAGHRRFTAAKDAGLKELPALVKELSDEDALECQVVENHQREDVNLMDEAEGFKRLLDMGKHTPETLAAKIDCSITYVLGRVRLMDLDEKVQDAIATGKLGPGHAVLFTRLKNTTDQKTLLREILDDDMSVRSAKDFINRNLAFSLKDAPFDASSCGTCPSRSRNQTALFEDLKKTDECTDRNCYYTKSKEHYMAIIARKKDEGFQVITDGGKIKELLERSRNAYRIIPPGGGYAYNSTAPNRYKSECAKCKARHAFYFYEDKEYGKKELKHGEICLDRDCLDAMQRGEAKGATAAEPQEKGPNSQKIREAALECRDRFLLSTLPARIERDMHLVDKLLILQLYRTRSINTSDAFLTAILGESVPAWTDDSVVYKKISGKFPVSEHRNDALNDALVKALSLTLDKDLCDTLLVLAPEAGVVMSRDFTIDEAWLKGKTKDELAAFVTELGLDIEVKASSKKGDLISAILEQDLKGRVPKEISEVLEVEGPEEESPDDLSGDGEGEDPGPTMPTPTKTKRKPRARA